MAAAKTQGPFVEIRLSAGCPRKTGPDRIVFEAVFKSVTSAFGGCLPWDPGVNRIGAKNAVKIDEEKVNTLD
jgi:hypothetical protein